ncbi:hypothetical protein QEZ54_06815 [Catellatospora sp. KI3]|uniref:nuclear transport factor 2 family protein n=1 Tax=Catellatospora sp. KI3 TaxID=3041620 RepID=UPI002482870C|nr:hypothetical protein [Catellatospora sp. KI3]MDI1460670.1 hypothetical protein [Catellatospora sp. KI3]
MEAVMQVDARDRARFVRPQEPQSRLRALGVRVAGRPERVLVGDGVVAVHAVYPRTGRPSHVGFEVFDLRDGASEGWRLMQPLSRHAVDARSQVDGMRFSARPPRQTGFNRRLVASFTDRVLLEGRFELLSGFVVPELIQHDPELGAGRAGLGATLARAQLVYRSRLLIVADGAFVLTVCAGTSGGREATLCDLYRVQQSMIAEHWDVIAPPAADPVAVA